MSLFVPRRVCYALSLLVFALPIPAQVNFTQIAAPPNFVGQVGAIDRGIVAFVGLGGSIWTAYDDGTHLTQVLAGTAPIPNGGAPIPYASSNLTPFYVPSGDTFQIGYGTQLRVGAGKVVFIGTDPAKAGTLAGIGLYSLPVFGGSVTPLVSADKFPFDYQVSELGQVVFQYGQKVYAVPSQGGTITALAANQALSKPPSLVLNNGSIAQASLFAYPAISGDSVVLNAGTAVSGGSWQTTSLASPGNFVDIADGKQFDVFSLWGPAIDGSTVIFGGQNRTTGALGIYASTAPGQYTTLADSTMPVPEGSGKFKLGTALAASDGIVVFNATDANGNLGIYKVPESGGPITKVIAVGDKIGPDTVADLLLGPQPLSGRKLAFTAAVHFDRVLFVADLSGSNPFITADGTGVMNGATNQPNSTIVAGSWVTIKGSDFSATTMDWSNLDFSKGLPTSINGVQVLFNGQPAATSYIQNNQINVQAPASVPASGRVSVQVVRNGIMSNTVNATAASASPGLFPYTLDGQTFFPAAMFSDGTLVGDPAVFAASRKAKPGDYVVLYATGLGISPAGTIVQPTPFTPPVQVLIDTTPASVTATYLVAAGQWQINIVVPSGLSDGNHQITIQTGGVSSPAGVVIPISN